MKSELFRVFFEKLKPFLPLSVEKRVISLSLIAYLFKVRKAIINCRIKQSNFY